MVRGRLSIAVASVATVSAGLLTAGILAATSAGAAAGTCASTECSNVVVTPQTVTAGTSSVFTVKVINETHETIQSVKITAPSDLAINGVPGGSVLFQGLSIPFGPSAVSLQVTATA